MMPNFFAGLAFAVFSAPAWAAPFIESPVREFANRPAAATERFPVLIVLKGPQTMVAGSEAERKLVRSELEMVANNSIQKFRASLKWPQSLKLERLWIINGFLTELTSTQIQTVMQSELVQGVYWSHKPYHLRIPERKVSSGSTSGFTYGLRKIKVPEVRARNASLTGRGVRVGILDTGIDANHPDLRGRLKVFKNFSPDKNDSPRDDYGHGTHVAGTIAGGNASGTSIGVAPDVDLVVARIFDGNGDSNRADIIKAMQWMADPDGNPATNDYAQVVNGSFGDDDPYNTRRPEDEPFCQIIGNWQRLNMLGVFSAGNSGGDASINLPGGCEEAVTVGAVEEWDRLLWFSSAGPARWKDLDLMKPDLVAPGFNVYSSVPNSNYEEMSGTSMSAPHVTGDFAILLQAFPNASAMQIRKAMIEGAQDLGDAGMDNTFGWGRPDLIKSLDLLKSSKGEFIP